MRTFPCSCGNTLFFGSTVCLRCGNDAGMCPRCQRVTSLTTSTESEFQCGHSDCGAAVRKCRNYETVQICNRCVPAEVSEPLCDYCQPTTTIPDLSVDGNREKWRRLEQAKHRVLYSLDQIGLPFRSNGEAGVPPLSFEFKADGVRQVRTGHAGGRITINIREADDVEREKARVAFGEPQRTLVGHFRHELGHYFWERTVLQGRLEECRGLFGDERNPPYAQALQHYHQHGPRQGWQESYISAYATMHPWEDFAETFCGYLAMATVLDTAGHFGVAGCCGGSDLDRMIENYRHVGLMANEFNRDMGLVDLVPTVLGPPVIDKLRYIHSLRQVQA